MTLEALTSSELSSFIVYDTISATGHHHHHELYADPSHGAFYPVDNAENLEPATGYAAAVADSPGTEQPNGRPSSSSTAAQGRKKRRRRPRSCKNKEEAESQRMTHIAVERNRRRQMNEHLAVLRSLMPESYIQRVRLSLSLDHHHLRFPLNLSIISTHESSCTQLRSSWVVEITVQNVIFP